MGNDIEIRVRVANNTATGLTAVNTALNRLRDEARDAGRGLDGLTERAAAASVALRSLKDSAQDAARALRSLNTAARNADGRMSTMSDRSRTLRRDTDDLDDSMRRLTTTMGGLRGSNGNLRLSDTSHSMDGLRKSALMLAPALIPIAAAAVPIAATLTAAGVAVGAFGLAIAGQLSAVKDAADAQKKYDDAVKKYGATSSQAATAEAAFQEQVKGMDPASRKAAASLSVLKDQYKDWSKSLAGDTMPVFTKSLAVAEGLFPKLTPVVKGAAGELDRFMTILAGGVNSGGFSAFMNSFADFSTGALAKANDALVHFMRTMSDGAGSSQFTEFMDYVKKAGPQVGETLANLATALVHVVAAASDTGLSMLSFVNAIAKLVNAVPSGVLSVFLQFAVALKAVKLAAAGMAALGGLSSAATAIAAMRTAAAGAVGPLAGLRAAFMSLSVGMRAALITTGIGAIVVALGMLSSMGGKTPPDVDKVTTSLKGLAETGKNTGESVRAWGANFEGLSKSISQLDPKGFDGFLQGWANFLGTDSTQVKNAKEDIDSLDKSLAGLVKGGNADVAAKALEDVGKRLKPKAFKELKGSLDDYKSALADAALEAKLTAESQGLFGAQAQKTQSALDAQKASADGLRQSIQALNDVNRAGLGGMIGFEAAIDAAAKAAKENAGALSMSGGVLNLNSEKARNAASALQDLADKTDSAAASARESGSSWETVNGIYTRGRSELIKQAQAMGLNKEQAAQLASQILKIPDKTATIKMNAEDAKAGLEAFNAAVKRTPGSKSVTLKTLSKGAESILEAFGYKVTHLKNGSVRVTAVTGGALSQIRNVSGALSSLNGKSATTYVNTIVTTTKKSVHEVVGATGGLYTGSGFRYAGGGLVQGPGTGTSDDVLAPWLSNGEFVVKAASVRKYGEKFLQALNDGQIEAPRFASGGKVTDAMKTARSSLRGQFGISGFGHAAGYQRTPFEKTVGAPSDVGALVSSLNQLRGEIKGAFSGKTESRLLKQFDSVGRSLIKYEKQLTSVNKSLEAAKSKLADLKSSAASLASSVKGGILSAANITRGTTADTPTTVASIMGGLTASRDKATAFSSALKQLKEKGLASSLIQQIGEAGIDGGGLDTAGALLGASSSEIGSINDLQKQINSAAGSAGKTTADSVYAAAIKSQTASVNRLQKSQDRLEKTMASLAKTMEKALKKALGGKAAGGIVGGAASGGIRGGLTWVGEHEPELLQLPVGSRVWSGPDSRRKSAAPWESMLTAPRRAHAPAAAAPSGGSEAPIVIQVKLGDKEFGELWVETGRRKVRSMGSIEATLKPPRGR